MAVDHFDRRVHQLGRKLELTARTFIWIEKCQKIFLLCLFLSTYQLPKLLIFFRQFAAYEPNQTDSFELFFDGEGGELLPLGEVVLEGYHHILQLEAQLVHFGVRRRVDDGRESGVEILEETTSDKILVLLEEVVEGSLEEGLEGPAVLLAQLPDEVEVVLHEGAGLQVGQQGEAVGVQQHDHELEGFGFGFGVGLLHGLVAVGTDEGGLCTFLGDVEHVGDFGGVLATEEGSGEELSDYLATAVILHDTVVIIITVNATINQAHQQAATVGGEALP